MLSWKEKICMLEREQEQQIDSRFIVNSYTSEQEGKSNNARTDDTSAYRELCATYFSHLNQKWRLNNLIFPVLYFASLSEVSFIHSFALKEMGIFRYIAAKPWKNGLAAAGLGDLHLVPDCPLIISDGCAVIFDPSGVLGAYLYLEPWVADRWLRSGTQSNEWYSIDLIF